VLPIALFIYLGNPSFCAQKASENGKKLIFCQKSHVWHAGMHIKNAKSVYFMFFLGPRLHN
jgi:hypothetical protein